MPSIIEITDLSISELAVYTSLTRAQLCSPQSRDGGLLIAESPHVIEAALDAGYAPVSMLMERQKAAALADSLLARCGDIPVYIYDEKTKQKMKADRIYWVTGEDELCEELRMLLGERNVALKY